MFTRHDETIKGLVLSNYVNRKRIREKGKEFLSLSFKLEDIRDLSNAIIRFWRG